jgi:DNA-binding transcriptional regulator YhcF (GntR family)
MRSLAAANKCGVGTIKSAVQELEKFGYLERSKKQAKSDDGRFADFTFTTTDPFQNPVTVEPRHGEMIHKEEQDSKEEQESKKNERTVLADAIVEAKPQVRESKSPKGKTTTIPADFIPKSFGDDIAANKTTDLHKALHEFIEYWTDAGTKRANWEATWRNNLQRVVEMGKYKKQAASIWDTIEETR